MDIVTTAIPQEAVVASRWRLRWYLVGKIPALTWRGLKYNSDCNHHHHHQRYFYWDACFFLLILKAMAKGESEELIEQADAQLDLKTTELTVEQQSTTAE